MNVCVRTQRVAWWDVGIGGKSSAGTGFGGWRSGVRGVWRLLGASVVSFCLLSSPGSGREARGAPLPVTEHPFTVLIDPGHGGGNLGCESFDGKEREKALMLRWAPMVAAAIRERLPHVKVELTREGDRELTLAHRVRMARSLRPDLLLSLHANASPLHNQIGFETYILAEQGWRLEAQRRELAALGSARGPLDRGLLRLRIDAELERLQNAALRFAGMVQTEVGRVAAGHPDRGVKQAHFDVLMGVEAPAVLHELGFYDHPIEGPILRRGDTLQLRADALARAVVEYYRDQYFRH